MIIYWAIGISWIAGVVVGIWISGYRNPFSVQTLLEDHRKMRIYAEQEFRKMVGVRMGSIEPADDYEKYLSECSLRKFATRVQQMFESYDQGLRGSEAYVQIMASAVPFEVKESILGNDDFREIEYY